MKTVAGVFKTRSAAAQTADTLGGLGIPENRVSLLFPGTPEAKLRTIPQSETEQPGVGGAIAGTVGAALGMAGGFELGVGATALIPGVGPVLAFGIAGAALLGAAGLAAGAAVGTHADENTTEGIPSDELYFYEDALRQGKSVVLVMAKDGDEENRARTAMMQNGAESLDAARDDWWLGVRDVEEEHYRALGYNFEQDQQVYRTGFEAALRRECRGKGVDAAADCLKWNYPDTWDTPAFRAGFDRGQHYWRRIDKDKKAA